MLRRSLALAFPAVLFGLSGDALAAGALLSGAGQALVEQRVAVAAGPARTTLWTSLRIQGASGPVALVVPVPPRAALDVSSDAWFEALEAATAPRVLPPEGVGPYCPGEEGTQGPSPYHGVGRLEHEATLAPSDVAVLADVDAVARWAASAGLVLSTEAAAQLGALEGVRFVAARFEAPVEPAFTKTLRIVMDGGEPILPLSLTRGGEGDVLVTAWLLGSGRGALAGAAPVTLPPASLTWNARSMESDYEAQRADALAQAGGRGVLIEGASHEALTRSIALGSDRVDSVVAAYFARASAYGDTAEASGTCAAVAAAALESSLVVAASCPRAALGVVDGALDCAESPGSGQTDPALLRCGPVADDLAVALSGLSPSSTWLTRASLWVAAGHTGADWPLIFGAGASVGPVVRAGSLSLDACSSETGAGGAWWEDVGGLGGAGSGAPGSGGPSTTGGSWGVDEPVHPDDVGGAPDDDMGCSCTGGTGVIVVEETGVEEEDEYYEDDGCSGDTTEPEYEDEYYEDDGCSGDTTEPEYEDEYYEDDCSGDTDDSAEAEDCSIAGDQRPGARRKRGPKLSVMVLGALALIAPIRRASRPRRSGMR